MKKTGYSRNQFDSFLGSNRKKTNNIDNDQERLRSVSFASCPNPIIVTDLNYRIKDCNHAALKICGFSRRNELIGKNAVTFIAKKHRQAALKKLASIKELGTITNVEFTLLDKNGREYEAEISSSVIQNSSGAPYALVASFFDISERKRVEEALAESERKYRSVVDNIAIGVSVIGPKMEILALNKQMQEWSPNVDASTKPICYRAFINPQRRDICPDCPTRKTLKDGQVHESITNTPMNGKIVNFRLISSPVKDKDGKIVAAIEIVDDVTAHKRLENELKRHSEHLEQLVDERTRRLSESEEQLRSLFENVPDGIYQSSRNGRILAANPALVRMLGYESMDELKQVHVARDLYVKKSERDFWTGILEKEGAIRNAEIVLKRKNGQRMVFLENAHVVRDGHGKILYYEGTLTDISERKVLEERLSALNSYSRKLNVAKSLDRIYGLALDAVETSLGFKYSSFEVVEKDTLRIARHRGYASLPNSLKLPLRRKKSGIVGKAVDARRPILVSDVRKDKDYVEGNPDTMSELAVPVIADSEVFGVLNVESEDLNAFGQKDVMLLMILASHAATAISNIEKRYELEKRNAQQASLMKSSAEMIHSSDLHQRLQAILDAIRGLGWRRVVLSVRDEDLDVQKREDIVAAGLTKDEIEYLWVNRQPGQIWRERFGPEFDRFKLGEFYYLPWSDPWVQKRFFEGTVSSHRRPEEMVDWNPDDLLYAPLRLADGRFVGVVSIDDPADGRRPSKESLMPLELFLHQAAVAIENARLIGQLDSARSQVQDYAKSLEVKVQERTKELVDAQARLLRSERLAAIGELAGMVGHDLRNPLTGIAGATYYLKTKYRRHLDARGKEMLQIIERDIDYSNKIINDLLEYSREIKLELTDTDPKSILKEVLGRLKVPRKVKIIDETRSELPVRVDMKKIMRVFTNLVKNALDAMPRGGTLRLKSVRKGDSVIFSFSDSGVGMSKETLDRLWTPLFTTKAKGMGFGLPICKRFVEGHGGRLRVESEAGKGSTFTVILPLIPKSEQKDEKIWVNVPESLLSRVNRT
jgi:PAS domain S-box-containing protein